MSRACYNCPGNLTDCTRENCIVADGIERAVESINRLVPGPTIQVCKDDVIKVNLVNMLRSQRVTSIHWHGVRQKGSPHMDGVGMITQCPVLPNTEFQYTYFKILS